MKKNIVLSFVALLMSFGLAGTQPAQAGVALITGSPFIALLAISSHFGAEIYSKATYGDDFYNHPTTHFFGVMGLVLLDGQMGQELSFAPIDSLEQARAIGLTEAEWVAYNSEIDEINLVRQEVVSRTQGTKHEDLEKAHALWLSYQDGLSVDAISALVKVTDAALKSIR